MCGFHERRQAIAKFYETASYVEGFYVRKSSSAQQSRDGVERCHLIFVAPPPFAPTGAPLASKALTKVVGLAWQSCLVSV